MKVEHRTFHNVEVRATGKKGPNGRPVVELRAVAPNVVDDYGTVWMASTFDRRMAERTAANPDDTPALCWSHDWADPIGHGIGYQRDPLGPMIEFELDDFEAVPRARQADAQVRSKTIRDCSVGFFDATRREPTADEKVRWPGALEIIEEADLDEVSLVLRGAVPGAKVAGIRGARVDLDAVIEIGRRKLAGELSDDEAKAAVELLSGEPETPSPAPGPSDPPPPDDAAVDAQLDAALDMALGRSGLR